jgi:Patched family
VTLIISVAGPEMDDAMTEVADKTSGEGNSFDSPVRDDGSPGYYDGDSPSPNGTVRTRMETMDSFDAIDNDLIPPPCASRMAAENAKAYNDDDFDDGSSNHSRSLHVSRGATLVPEKPKSAIVRHAYKIHQWWVRCSHTGRGALLRGVVGLAKIAARYPYATIVAGTALSIALITGGFYTNFDVRLDMEIVFTPTSSEVWEHYTFLGNDKMYEGVGNAPKRRLMKGFDAMAYDNHGEGFTWRELQRLNRHRELKKHDENDGLGSNSSNDDEGNWNLSYESVSTTTVQLGSAFTSDPTLSPSLIPTHLSAAAAAVEPIKRTSIPSIMPSQSPTATPTVAPSAAVEKKQWEPGIGPVFSILVHADKQNVFTLEGMEKMWDALDSVRYSEHYGPTCTGHATKSFHNVYGENTCEIRSVTRFWNHNRTLYNEKVKTEDDLYNTANAGFYDDGGFVDLPFILAQMEEDEKGRPVAAQAFYAWVFLKNKARAPDLVEDLKDLQKRWEDESSDNEIVYILEFSAPDSFASEVMRAITGDLPLIPVVFIVMSAFTCLVFFKCDRLKSRTMLGVGAVVTVFMSTLASYGLMFICGKLDEPIPSFPAAPSGFVTSLIGQRQYVCLLRCPNHFFDESPHFRNLWDWP